MDQTTRIFRANAFCSIGKVKKKAAWIIQNGLIYSVKKISIQIIHAKPKSL
jgi:hypothetical protein